MTTELYQKLSYYLSRRGLKNVAYFIKLASLTSEEQEYYELLMNHEYEYAIKDKYGDGFNQQAFDIAQAKYQIEQDRVDEVRSKIEKMLTYGLNKEQIKNQLGSSFDEELFTAELSSVEHRDLEDKHIVGLSGLRDKLKITEGDIVVMSPNQLSSFSIVGQNKLLTPAKPNGLWYACGSGWLNFVINERFNYDAYKYVYKLTLDYSNILRIKTLRQLIDFTKNYGFNQFASSYDRQEYGQYNSIEWGRVATTYSGIEICPYIYEARLEISWYYGWDIASGCIWDDRAIKKTVLVAERVNDYAWEIQE